MSKESSLDISNSHEDECCGNTPSMQRSSQVSLCDNVGRLNMGGKRGRPRKKSKSYKNPFDLGFNRRKLKDGILKRKLKSKQNVMDDYGNTELICSQENALDKTVKEAELIMECANNMGLMLANDPTDSKKLIVEKLSKGEL